MITLAFSVKTLMRGKPVVQSKHLSEMNELFLNTNGLTGVLNRLVIETPPTPNWYQHGGEASLDW